MVLNLDGIVREDLAGHGGKVLMPPGLLVAPQSGTTFLAFAFACRANCAPVHPCPERRSLRSPSDADCDRLPSEFHRSPHKCGTQICCTAIPFYNAGTELLNLFCGSLFLGFRLLLHLRYGNNSSALSTTCSLVGTHDHGYPNNIRMCWDLLQGAKNYLEHSCNLKCTHLQKERLHFIVGVVVGVGVGKAIRFLRRCLFRCRPLDDHPRAGNPREDSLRPENEDKAIRPGATVVCGGSLATAYGGSKPEKNTEV